MPSSKLQKTICSQGIKTSDGSISWPKTLTIAQGHHYGGGPMSVRFVCVCVCVIFSLFGQSSHNMYPPIRVEDQCSVCMRMTY